MTFIFLFSVCNSHQQRLVLTVSLTESYQLLYKHSGMPVKLIRFIDMGNFILTLDSILPWTGMLKCIKWRK